MIKIADGMKASVRSAAEEMIAAGKTTAPMLSPDGDPTFYLSTDKSRLRVRLMSVDIGGVTVFVGLSVDDSS